MLRHFGAEYELQVARTRKRGVSVKADYMNVILSHASACTTYKPPEKYYNEFCRIYH